jgi:hypothetical protein
MCKMCKMILEFDELPEALSKVSKYLEGGP